MGTQRSFASCWLLVSMAALLLPCLTWADEDPVADANDAARRAEAHVEAGNVPLALESYAEAIQTLEALYQKEHDRREVVVRSLRGRKESPSGELAAELHEAFLPIDALGADLARWEHEVARLLSRLDRLPEAVRALGRALGHDPSLWETIRSDAHLKATRAHADFEELSFLLGPGRAHLDTGDPIETFAAERNFRRTLGLAPGSEAIGALPGVHLDLFNLAKSRADAQAPERLDYAEYYRLVRLGILLPRTHYGWAYRHGFLFGGGGADLHQACQQRWEERRDEPDGPIHALMACFTGAHVGRLSRVGEHLEYLEARSPYLHDRALDGVKWLLDACVEHQMGLPNTRMDQIRALLAEVEQQVEATRLSRARVRAWCGIPDAMFRYGWYHLDGLYGLTSDPQRAVAWYRGSEALGYLPARTALSGCYRDGHGVEQDEAYAFELAQSAAREGDIGAHNQVGYAYMYARGVERDYAKARVAFEKAAEGGNIWAMESLGLLLQRGEGGAHDFALAKRWYERSGTAGHPRSERRLGNLAIDARQTDADLERAITHLDKALETSPTDRLAVLYAWTARRLLGREDEAEKIAEDAMERESISDFDRALYKAMTRSRFSTNSILRLAGRQDNEEDARLAVGHVNYLAGIAQLAAGKEKIAHKYFAASAEDGQEIDSIRHSALLELRRLDAE